MLDTYNAVLIYVLYYNDNIIQIFKVWTGSYVFEIRYLSLKIFLLLKYSYPEIDFKL